LILGDRPYFAGLEGFRQDGLFTSIRGEWAAEVDKVREGLRRLNLAGYAGTWATTQAQELAGQLTE
jgi:hypothetical protein